VYVTNNTGAPVEWVTSFNVPGNYKIKQKWNMSLTQTANFRDRTDADSLPKQELVLQEDPNVGMLFVTEPFDEGLGLDALAAQDVETRCRGSGARGCQGAEQDHRRHDPANHARQCRAHC